MLRVGDIVFIPWTRKTPHVYKAEWISIIVDERNEGKEVLVEARYVICHNGDVIAEDDWGSRRWINASRHLETARWDRDNIDKILEFLVISAMHQGGREKWAQQDGFGSVEF